jgi:hypothetical protein
MKASFGITNLRKRISDFHSFFGILPFVRYLADLGGIYYNKSFEVWFGAVCLDGGFGRIP